MQPASSLKDLIVFHEMNEVSISERRDALIFIFFLNER